MVNSKGIESSRLETLFIFTKFGTITIVLASLVDSRINLESTKLQYALGLDNHLLLFYFFAC